MREFLRAKIHRARVTAARLDYEGSFGIDAEYMERVGILPFESIDVYNVTNGHRLRTYAIEMPRGSRRFESNGAAAHLFREGDVVIIACFTWMKEKQLAKFEGPKILLVDSHSNEEKEYYQTKIDTTKPAPELRHFPRTV